MDKQSLLELKKDFAKSLTIAITKTANLPVEDQEKVRAAAEREFACIIEPYFQNLVEE